MRGNEGKEKKNRGRVGNRDSSTYNLIGIKARAGVVGFNLRELKMGIYNLQNPIMLSLRAKGIHTALSGNPYSFYENQKYLNFSIKSGSKKRWN